MTISDAGLDLIRSFEGLRLTAYQDQRGIWTCGYGSTAGVKKGDVWTKEEADQHLREDLKTAEDCINRNVYTEHLNQNMFDALVSLVFNIGQGNFVRSSMLSLLNAGSLKQAADQFLVWSHTNGRTSPGLLRRREAERSLFMSGEAAAQQAIPIQP